MPVEFLTDEQAEAYGKFAEEPTRPELERFFFLDDVDQDLIALRRTEHHRLGFALQMCTVRYVGLFLEDPLAVPWPVIEHLAVQLGIEDPSVVKRYMERRQTLYDHAWEIRDAYGHHPYEDDEWGRRFRTFLHGRAWTHAEGPKALFDHAVGWLRRHRVLLLGVSVLARQVSEVRRVAEKRLHATSPAPWRTGRSAPTAASPSSSPSSSTPEPQPGSTVQFRPGTRQRCRARDIAGNSTVPAMLAAGAGGLVLALGLAERRRTLRRRHRPRRTHTSAARHGPHRGPAAGRRRPGRGCRQRVGAVGDAGHGTHRRVNRRPPPWRCPGVYMTLTGLAALIAVLAAALNGIRGARRPAVEELRGL
ncbi:hypothetical protein SHO565_76740 [Streptomyces sp. HO565]